MTDNLTYKGEALLYSWSDSAAGRKVTFLLPDEGTPHPFKDYKSGPKYGQAFALGCTPIDYDNPESPPEPKPGDPVKSVAGYAKPPMTEAQRCGMLCADKAFQKWCWNKAEYHYWASKQGDRLVGMADEEIAAEYVRAVCRVTSRRHIGINLDALESWRSMLAQFEADTGRMASRTR
jgi:hypothetical protein